MNELCEPEFLRALCIGVVVGFAFGFFACALATLSRLADSEQ